MCHGSHCGTGSEYPIRFLCRVPSPGIPAQAKHRHRSGAGLSWSEQLHTQAGHGQDMSMDTAMDMDTDMSMAQAQDVCPHQLLCFCAAPLAMHWFLLFWEQETWTGISHSPEHSGQCATMPAYWTRWNELDSINLKPREAEAMWPQKDKKYE